MERNVATAEPVDVDGGKYQKSKKVEITLDSGAGASCWPESVWKSIPMGPKTKGVKLKVANGEELKYYSTKNVRFVPKDGFKRSGKKMKEEMCEMKFHVTDTIKPLAAAMATVKMGNRVVLEDGLGKSYIENARSGDKIMLTFVFDAEFPENDKSQTTGFRWQGWPQRGDGRVL